MSAGMNTGGLGRGGSTPIAVRKFLLKVELMLLEEGCPIEEAERVLVGLRSILMQEPEGVSISVSTCEPTGVEGKCPECERYRKKMRDNMREYRARKRATNGG